MSPRILLLWLWGHTPVTNVDVIFVLIPIVAAISLIAAILASAKGSQWWLVALIPPIMTLMDVLAGG